MTDAGKVRIPTPEERRPLVPVEIPAWGVTLYARALSLGDSLNLPEDNLEFSIQLLLRGTCHPDGSRVWSDEQRDEVLAYPGPDLLPLVERLMEINHLTKQGMEERKGN